MATDPKPEALVIFDRLVQEPTITGADLNELMAAIAPPGQKQEQKREAVKALYEARGRGGTNSQGVHVVDTIEGYLSY